LTQNSLVGGQSIEKSNTSFLKTRKLQKSGTSSNYDLNLQEGISAGVKRVKIETMGLGSRRQLPESSFVNHLS
jgi:hypothetical protein